MNDPLERSDSVPSFAIGAGPALCEIPAPDELRRARVRGRERGAVTVACSRDVHSQTLQAGGTSHDGHGRREGQQHDPEDQPDQRESCRARPFGSGVHFPKYPSTVKTSSDAGLLRIRWALRSAFWRQGPWTQRSGAPRRPPPSSATDGERMPRESEGPLASPLLDQGRAECNPRGG